MQKIKYLKPSIWIGWILVAVWLQTGSGLFAPATASPDRESMPVWGSKPVLAYFVLTGSLAETLQDELDLTPSQFEALEQVAREESASLRALEQGSQAIIADQGLTLAEKRVRIAASGYNRDAGEITAATQVALQERLDETTYARLVEWIEARWQVERRLHGLEGALRSLQAQKAEGTRAFSIFAAHFDAGDASIVALPDKCLRLANNGHTMCADSGYISGANYSVHLSYQGNTTTATVGDSGPWNVDDNYWAGVGDPQPRRFFPDLPAGMPEAQAAYYDDYNGGLDQYGRAVTAPFGIDLSQGVGNDLGLQPGYNEWIEVSFTWTEGWDEIQSQAILLNAPTSLTPPYTGDMCVSAWHRTSGYGDYAYLTLNVSAPGSSTNSAEWRPELPAGGDYQVLAFVPDHPPTEWLCPELDIARDTANASYTIQHSGGQSTAGGDQGPLSNMWLDLGEYHFNAGSDGYVRLSDVSGETDLSHTVAFSALLFRHLDYPTPVPPPPPTPTPTAVPQPFAWAGNGIAPPSTTITIPLGAANVPLPGIGAATIDLYYDPGLLEALTCLPDPGSVFDTQSCNLSFERDGINPDTLRLSLGSPSGVEGNPELAQVVFLTGATPGQVAILNVNVMVFQYPDGESMEVRAYDGLVCIEPCRNRVYLPVVQRNGR